MKTFLLKVLVVLITMVAGLVRGLKSFGMLFLSEEQMARRAAEEREAERLDRLRNPSNYQGR
jgi:hypothetical protein